MADTVRVPIDPVVLRVPAYDSRTTLTDDEAPYEVMPYGAGLPVGDATVLRRRALTYGLGALLLGTLANATIAGLAFRSYKATGSAVRPAVIIGVGGLAVSAATAWLLVRGLADSAVPALVPDNRAMAAGAGLMLVR